MVADKLFLKIHSVGGRDYLFPSCHTSRLLLKFAGARHFDANMVMTLKELGFRLEAKEKF